MRSAIGSATLATLRCLPRGAWALYLGTFVNRFGSFVVPFLVLYLTRRGFSAAQAGLAAGAYGLGSLGAAALGGALADHIGRRATIALSMFSSAGVMLLLARASWLPLIAALTALAGLTAELYRPATGALLADLVPEGRRVTNFALYRLAVNTGVAVGTATAGFLADRAFLLLFLGDAATSVVFGVVALAALPRGAPPRVRSAEPAPRPVDGPAHRLGGALARIPLAGMLTDRAFALFLIATILGSFVYFQSLSTLGLQIRAYGLPNAAYGVLLALNGVAILVCELPLTAVTQRLPARRVMAAGQLLIGAGFALVALARTPPLLAGTVLLWTLGEMLHSPVAAAYVADRAPAHLRGRYQGAYGLASALGLIFAPALGARLFARNPGGLWLLCGALGALAAALIFVAGSAAHTHMGGAAQRRTAA